MIRRHVAKTLAAIASFMHDDTDTSETETDGLSPYPWRPTGTLVESVAARSREAPPQAPLPNEADTHAQYLARVRSVCRLAGVRTAGEYDVLRLKIPELDLPADLPAVTPAWRGWRHFLGLSHPVRERPAGLPTRHTPPYPFFEARRAARHAGISSVSEYYRLFRERRLPLRLPVRPDVTYAGHWQGWADFFDAEEKPEDLSMVPALTRAGFVHYDIAAFIAKSFDPQTEYAWRLHSEWMHPGLPERPDQAYEGQGWQGWQAFFGR